jgi:type I restriction enzyme M protein
MTFTLQDIIQNSDYALTIFSPEEIAAIELFEKKGKPYLRDFCSNKDRPAKPEEIVRQLFLYRLLNTYGYPASRIATEKGVQFGSTIAEKRADIVIHDKDDPTAAYVIVEIKKPRRRDGLEQLKSYCNAEGAPIAVWSNGGEEVILRRTEPNVYKNLPTIPRADQTLAEIINERVTIEELTERNKLVTEKWTLKKIILDLENLVLANAGVDAFDEVFKLIYAKLYDEAQAKRRKGRYVEFRASGETHSELYEKINNLFEEAKRRWPGVFLEGEKIDLTPDALAVCVSFLQDIKLFNSNLQVIDEAFEYLSTQVAKGAKGQYFTPRYVIDQCVRMLNPKDGEYMIDTAAGSCGFTVHTMFYVWGGELTSDGPNREQTEYANEYVYGLDFDSRSIKIAKALNLIAGDGKSNVYRVNSLAPFQWGDDARVGLAPRLRRFRKSAETQENVKSYREFDFDILMTNPPFAGDVSDSRILHQYELAKQWKGIDLEALEDEAERERYADSPFRYAFKESGKWAQNQSRDLLFIERNLQFLKPGGRMAIVLPQGRFNNVSDARLRHFISEHARIVAVVGLHRNTFKPHTGTKTSVLFVQKWNDDPKAGVLCPKVDDYPIFFATSEHGGKDNSGEYIYVKNTDTGEKLHDLFNHEVFDQDLFDVRIVLQQQLDKLRERHKVDPVLVKKYEDDYTELLKHLPQRPTIAEAFIEFAKRQNFSFWQKDED